MHIDLNPLIYSLEPQDNLGFCPTLALLKHGKRKDSEAYIKSIEKKANKLGVNIVTVDLENRIDVGNVVKEIQDKANAVLPIKPFAALEEILIKACIDEEKDIDNYTGEAIFENCTVEAVQEILKFLNISKQAKVCIIGRNLGLQISLSLLDEDFSPTVCHSRTENLETYTKDADVIISVTGVKNLITKSMVKVNALVIDVGLGDVHPEVIQKAYVTPVRNGVGAVTTAILFKHVFETIQG